MIRIHDRRYHIFSQFTTDIMQQSTVIKDEGGQQTYEAGRKEPLVMGRRLKDSWNACLPPGEASGLHLLPAREAQLRVTYLLKWNNSSYYHNYEKNPNAVYL